MTHQPTHANVDTIDQDLIPRLAPPLLRSAATSTTGRPAFYHLTISDTAALHQLLQLYPHSFQVTGHWPSTHLIRIQTTDTFLYRHLLPLNGVQFIDAGDKHPREETPLTDYNDRFNTINTLHSLYPALKGGGITLSVRENRFDTTDIDFLNRILPTTLVSPNQSAHATIMATLIGGAGNTYFSGRGVADGSTLSSASFDVLLPDTTAYRQYNISIQNHSYGVGVENYYGSDAAAYDASMISDTTLLHVFSAGNSGTDSAAEGPYINLPGWANLTGSFKQAKNILVAGSLDSFYTVPLLSSKGPAFDGRIKPELVAYGQDGSSGAAALTSGTAALLQQAYSNTHNRQLPASALVKAILVNSATSLGQHTPNFTSGYGALNACRSIQNMLAARFAQGTIKNQDTDSILLIIPSNAIHLKILLAWNDVPATPNATKALVNDLDLSVIQPATSQQWLPWVLNTTPQADSLNLPPTQQRDTLNVLEQVTIDSPAAGPYIVRIHARQLPSTPQSWYLAYQWDTAQTFQWTSPAPGDHFIAGTTNVFVWQNQYNASKGTLEISYDSGHQWQTITSDLNLNSTWYRWLAPDRFTNAIARIRLEDTTFTTDTFSISRQAYPTVGFSCPDSLLLHWHATPQATGYRLFQLGNQYMQPLIALTTDTFAILQHPASTSPYYAIASLLDSLHPGVTSSAINYNTQGVACYFNNFLADLLNEHYGLLQAQLGSTYNLQSLRFEKQTPNGWHTLSAYPATSLNYTTIDSNLTQGLNTYRAAITTTSGAQHYSDPSTIYYLSTNSYLLFPNPVRTQSTLYVLSKDPFNKTLIIYNMQGQKIWEQLLQQTLETVPINRLSPGAYIVIIFDQDKKVAEHTLLVQ